MRQLASAIYSLGGGVGNARFVVFTGGEPLLQLDTPLIEAIACRGFYIAVETNGTVAVPSGIQWLCVSPKAGTDLRVRAASEVKLVFPQEGIDPESIRNTVFATRYSLQPMDGPHLKENTAAAIAYVLDHPTWRLSLQTHKMAGIA